MTKLTIQVESDDKNCAVLAAMSIANKISNGLLSGREEIQTDDGHRTWLQWEFTES